MRDRSSINYDQQQQYTNKASLHKVASLNFTLSVVDSIVIVFLLLLFLLLL